MAFICLCRCRDDDYEVVKSQMVYDGAYDLAKRPHGHGTCYFEDGESYCGQWEHGRRHGLGRYTFADGKTLFGYFDNDKFVGSTNPNGYGAVKANDLLQAEQHQEKSEEKTKSGRKMSRVIGKKLKKLKGLTKRENGQVGKDEQKRGSRAECTAGFENKYNGLEEEEVRRILADDAARKRKLEEQQEKKRKEEKRRQEREDYYRKKYNITRSSGQTVSDA